MRAAVLISRQAAIGQQRVNATPSAFTQDVAAAPPASPPSAAEPQQQLAALRSAAAAAAAEVSSTAAAAAAAGGSSAAPGGEPAAPAEAALAAHPRHVFVFSTAGKPIFCYRGDESRLAGLMATAKAILSVAHSKGHTLKHVRRVPPVLDAGGRGGGGSGTCCVPQCCGPS